MGTFGHGPFDNDDALELVGEFRDPVRRLRAALKDAQGDYVQVDVGARAWAAAEVVALCFGRGELAEIPPCVADLLLDVKPSEKFRVLALRAVERLQAEGSEMAQLWAEADALDDHRVRLDDLRSRLVAAAAGAIPIPKPKKGDVLVLQHEARRFVVQVVSKREVVVFEGEVFEGDAFQDEVDPTQVDIAAWLDRPGHRVATYSSVLLPGRRFGNAPLAPVSRGTKRYAHLGGGLAEYEIGSVTSSGAPVSFEEVRDMELCMPYSLAELATIAAGGWQPPTPPSPERRLSDLRELWGERWAALRAKLSPHPFGDVEALRDLVVWMGSSGVGHTISSIREQTVGFGPPFVTVENVLDHARNRSEENEYQELVFAGLVALWTDGFGRERWPSALAIPEVEPASLADAVMAARVIVRGLRSPDSTLRQIWEAGEDGGAAFDAHLDALEPLLTAAAERYPWSPPQQRQGLSDVERSLLEATFGPDFQKMFEDVVEKLRK